MTLSEILEKEEKTWLQLAFLYYPANKFHFIISFSYDLFLSPQRRWVERKAPYAL